MTCAACETTSPKDFWCCPQCKQLHSRRMVKWGGLIFSPLIFFVIGSFGYDLVRLLGLPKEILYFGWVGPFFPFAGIPFIWWGEGGWVQKARFSLVYVVFHPTRHQGNPHQGLAQDRR